MIEETKAQKKYLSCLFKDENIVVNATTGLETITESDIFKGRVYLDPLPNIPGKPTLAMSASIYEVVGDGTFVDFFGSFGEDRSRWQESQVVQFCRDHRDKIRTGSYVTLFELESSSVVGVLIDDDNRLRVFVRNLSYPAVWQAYYRRRLVIPL
ncbi:MAG: hypothetical protein ABL917_03855 [Parcubacteria group bacterium]